MNDPTPPPHLLLLLTSRTYRAEAFLKAADQLGVRVTIGVEAGSVNAAGPGQLSLDFSNLQQGVESIEALSAKDPLTAVLSAEDEGALLAAAASQKLGLRHSSQDAVLSARDKLRMRQRLAQSPLPSPPFWEFPLATDPEEVADRIRYPSVVKPRFLSGSRGVIRADDPAQFVEAFRRTALILRQPELQTQGGDLARSILVEGYIPGQEVAVEGLLDDGHFHLLAIFDKPDPLIGPTFEETIYITPSRLTQTAQDLLAKACQVLTATLGLKQGPLHAEFRLNDQGMWPIDVAPRSIGGLCSRALRFGNGASIEELILSQALDLDLDDLAREKQASGVMMIPTPMPGWLGSVSGTEQAIQVDGIEDIVIDVLPGQRLVGLPESSRYLGFIFARLSSPEAVEQALRAAHELLHFKINPNPPEGGTIQAEVETNRAGLDPGMEEK